MVAASLSTDNFASRTLMPRELPPWIAPRRSRSVTSSFIYYASTPHPVLSISTASFPSPTWTRPIMNRDASILRRSLQGRKVRNGHARAEVKAIARPPTCTMLKRPSYQAGSLSNSTKLSSDVQSSSRIACVLLCCRRVCSNCSRVGSGERCLCSQIQPAHKLFPPVWWPRLDGSDDLP